MVNTLVDSFLTHGDPVLVQNGPNMLPQIANVMNMTKANTQLRQIDVSRDQDLKEIELTLKFIDTKLIGNRMYWCGDLIGEEIKCAGENCLPIKPNIDLEPPEGVTRFYFDMNLLHDVGVHLQMSVVSHQQSQPGQSIIKKRCFKCRKSIPLSEMRAHVGVHILSKDVVGSNICGFCGRGTCMTKCKNKSKKGGIPIYTLDETDCAYFFAYGRSKVFNKRTNICTNRFDQCPIKGCFSEIWKYNFKSHLQEKHPHEDPDDYTEWRITGAEMNFLLSQKKAKGK